MKKIRIAQIGTSGYSHGNCIWQSLQKQSDLFEVVGYAFPEGEEEKFPERAQDFAPYRKMTVEEILSDPEIEAVAVETEELYLTKYALTVARAGKHLHMEKPGGASLADFSALVEELRAHKLVFSVGYMYRFNPIIQALLAKIKSGALGEIYAVEAHMDCLYDTTQRAWLSRFPGGMLFFLGCHLIDLIYRIQGEPQRVIPLSCATGFDGVDAKDYGMAVFQYERGVSFAKTCAMEGGGFLRRQLVICGEKGTVELKPLESVVGENGELVTAYAEFYNAPDKGWSTPWVTGQSEPYDRYDAMMRHFAQCVHGKQNPYTYDYELGLYKLLLCACGEECKHV